MPGGKVLEVIREGTVKNKSGPDYIVKDTATGLYYGVELTSAYLDDRSVPDVHIMSKGVQEIPYDLDEIKKYKGRLLKVISEKIQKADKYDRSFPLILSVYVNEYITIHMWVDDFESLVKANEHLFNNISPFVEVVFWPLFEGGAFSVKP